MITPSWLANVLAAVMLVLTAYSIGRVVAARWWRRRVDIDVETTHSLMGLSMAGMLVRSLTTLPSGAWVVVFVASGTWFAGRWLISRPMTGISISVPAHLAPHIVASGSMVYMLKAMPSWSGMAGLICGSHMTGMTTMGMTPTRWPPVGVALAVALIGGALALASRHFWPLDNRRPADHEQRELLQTAPSSATGNHQGGLGGATYNVELLEPLVVPGHLGSAAELAPRSAVLCQIVMALTMGYMLVSML